MNKNSYNPKKKHHEEYSRKQKWFIQIAITADQYC